MIINLSNTFHTLRPSFVPSFSFSWVQLISHRNFLASVLLADGVKVEPLNL
jgi:CCR4-NOT transcription complex subunit 1